MEPDQTYDVIILGSGPGGEGAAMKAAKNGKRVAVFDDLPAIGGACTHRGTIPSKALRHVIQQICDLNMHKNAQWPDLLRKAEEVVRNQVTTKTGFYARNDVDVIEGRAIFVGPHTVEVTTRAGLQNRYRADHFVIATGSRPYHPPDVNFSHPRILDANDILQLKRNPRRLAIYGAGVIGCEYASIFGGLQTKVNLINNRGELLSFLDDEIIDALAYHLREQGVLIRHNEQYQKIEPHDDGVRIHLESNKLIHADYLLWAQGRTGNSQNMGLEALDIATNERGSIEVNDNYQTSLPHIYAVGDVVGFPSLASAAFDQGRYAAAHICERDCEHRMVEDIPTGIYTLPEISSVGETSKELTARKVPYEVGHAFFRNLARAQITGHTTGMLKILFHRESLAILGIHCFGDRASEIVHIGQAIMAQKGEANTLKYFVNTTFNYPTMAEAYRVAALNGLNRIR